jgi:uncharacterized protein YbjT (DUF2867 family)
MSKVIAIVGATGGQGGSVASYFLQNPLYKVHAITRNASSPSAQSLASRGAKIIAADLNDEASLVKAFSGAHAIFAITDFFEPFSSQGPKHAMDVEYAQGLNLARAAAKTQTLEHFIWSTLPDAKAISDGKFLIPHFDAKARLDAYIKSQPELLKKTTFLWIAFYASNLFFPVYSPNFIKSAGKHAWLLPNPAETLISSVGDHTKNVGIIAAGVLAHPEKTLGGKYVFGNVETMTSQEYLDIWSKVTGKPALFVQVDFADYKKMYPMWGEEMGTMQQYWAAAGEKSWSSSEGIVSVKDIGVEGQLVRTEEAFRGLDFSSF